MKRTGIIIAAILITVAVQAQFQRGRAEFDQLAGQCKDLKCVDEAIQYIDSKIAMLVNRRLAFVRRGAELKKRSAVLPNEPSNRAYSTKDAQGLTKAVGGPAGATTNIFKELNRQSEQVEKDIFEGK